MYDGVQMRGNDSRNTIRNTTFRRLIMTFPTDPAANKLGCEHSLSSVYHANTSAVSWSAIFAGAAATAALALILLMLGTGLGLSSVSPWAYSRWVSVHTDEVYFRDTAHGFLSWAVAALATAALLTSVIGSIVSGGIQAGGVATTAVTSTTSGMAGGSEMAKWEPMKYFVDSLFRKDVNASVTVLTPDESGGMSSVIPEQTAVGYRAEVAHIFMNSIHTGPLPAEDLRYVGLVVAQRTGLTQLDAEKRVVETYARVQAKLSEAETAAKQAADSARKAFVYASLWLFISLLIGAFVASFAATYGGRQRDM